MSLLKKRLSCITTSTLLISSVLGAAPVLYAKNATITYHFSDQQTEGWVARGNASVKTTPASLTAEPDPTNYCLYVSDRSADWHGVSKDLISTLKPGNDYTVSVFVKFDEGEEEETINLTLETGLSGDQGYLRIASNEKVKKGEWTKLTGSVTLPEDASKANIYVESPNTNLSFYVDEIEITGEFQANGEDTPADVTTWDFEGEDLGPWFNRGDATVNLVDTEAHTGTKSAFVSGRTQNWQGISMDPVSSGIVEVGRPYTYSAWLKYDNPAFETRQFILTMQYDDADGETHYDWIANKEVTSDTWENLSGSFTIPENAISVQFYIQINEASGEACSDFYVDDVSITAEPYEEIDVEIQKDIPALQEVYKDYFKIGTALSSSHMNALEKELVKYHFNSITCENAMKPESMLDREATIAAGKPQVKFSDDAKAILDFAKENNIPVRGHVLAWHSQTPNWFFCEDFSNESDAKPVSKEVMEERLKDYIDAVFALMEEEYPDVDFYAFDVVNEAVNPDGPDGLRLPSKKADGTATEVGENDGSMWMTTIGKDFIEDAFRYAREASQAHGFGNIKLAYNDYNECDANKADIIYDICKDLYSKGLIDIIGMQGHYNMTNPGATQLENTIRKYASIGDNIEIQITELDINAQEDTSKKGLIKQAYRYKEIFDVLKKLKEEGAANITSCVVWGVKDDESWRSEAMPLLFDKNYQAKPAYYGIADPANLPVLTQDITGYNVTKSVNQAFLIQNGTSLNTTSDVKVAVFKIAWDQEKVYVSVIPQSNFKTGTVKVFVDDQVVTADLKSNTIIEVLYSGSAKELPFDIFVQSDDVKATWNNLSYDGSSIPNKENFGKLLLKDSPKFVKAEYGTPTIDGSIDKVWSKATAIDVNNFSEGKDGATATARTLWDKDHIYVLMKVKDSKLSKASANTYEQDSVEIFIDEDNAKTKSYEAGDVQYRVNFDNERSINGASDVDSFTTATSLTDDGYIVELALPARLGKFSKNQVIGFDFQVNDDADGDGKRDNVSNWNDLTGQGWSSTADYGVIQLAKKSSSGNSSSSSSNSSTPSNSDSTTKTDNSTDSTKVPSTTEDKKDVVTATVKDDTNETTVSNASKATVEKVDAAIEKASETTKAVNSSKYTVELTSNNSTVFTEPAELTFDLSDETISDPSVLSLARFTENADGTVTITRLGGSYDATTGTFSAYVDQAGTYGLVSANDLINIQMTVGSVDFKQNQGSKQFDVVPQIINNTTMVPLRAIGELLGAEFKWNPVTKQVTIIQDDKTITLDTKSKGSAVIVNGRTLVPLRYIAEKLGANVLWIPETKSIQITK